MYLRQCSRISISERDPSGLEDPVALGDPGPWWLGPMGAVYWIHGTTPGQLPLSTIILCYPCFPMFPMFSYVFLCFSWFFFVFPNFSQVFFIFVDQKNKQKTKNWKMENWFSGNIKLFQKKKKENETKKPTGVGRFMAAKSRLSCSISSWARRSSSSLRRRSWQWEGWKGVSLRHVSISFYSYLLVIYFGGMYYL